MNKKLYTRLYRDNPGDFSHPIYVGGYYEKEGGLPSGRFRLCSVLLCGAASVLLLLIGFMVSVPGKAIYSTLPYVAAYLPAIMGVFAALQLPADEERIREDTYHNSLEKLQMYGSLGLIFSAAAFAGGVLACVLARTFGWAEAGYLLALAGCAVCFSILRRLRKKQKYTLKKD